MEDFQTYQNVMEDFSHKSHEDLDKWESDVNFVSLRTRNIQLSADSTSNMLLPQFDFPTFYSTLINQKGEMQIGDTILFFANKKTYFVPANQESRLKNAQGEFDTTLIQNFPKQQVTTEILERSTNKNVWAQYQQHFGGSYKFVFELVDFRATGIISLRLRMKTEQLRRRNWWSSREWVAVGNRGTVNIRNLVARTQFVSNTINTTIRNVSFPTITTSTTSDYSLPLHTEFVPRNTVFFGTNSNFWRFDVSANSLRHDVTQPTNGSYQVNNARWFRW